MINSWSQQRTSGPSIGYNYQGPYGSDSFSNQFLNSAYGGGRPDAYLTGTQGMGYNGPTGNITGGYSYDLGGGVNTPFTLSDYMSKDPAVQQRITDWTNKTLSGYNKTNQWSSPSYSGGGSSGGGSGGGSNYYANRVNTGGGTGGGGYGGGTGGSGGGSGGWGQDDVMAARNQVINLTQGRGDELRNDPYTMAALNYMKGVVGGQNVPFTEQVINSQAGAMSDMNAAAESAQAKSLRDSMGASGGNMSDPSYQAMVREQMAQRQAANTAGYQDILRNATQKNFDARFAGSNALASQRGAQNALINQMYGSAADFLAQTSAAQQIGQGLAASGMGGGSNTSVMNERLYGSPRVGSSSLLGGGMRGFSDNNYTATPMYNTSTMPRSSTNLQSGWIVSGDPNQVTMAPPGPTPSPTGTGSYSNLNVSSLYDPRWGMNNVW